MTTHVNQDDVIAANIQVHRVEAPHYDALHFEERNFFERKRRMRALAVVKRELADRERTLAALDVGCGTGKMSLLLADNGFDVTSLDLSFPMLSVFKERLRQENRTAKPKLVCADMFSFLADCPRQFDLIVFCGTLHHVRDVSEALRLASSRLCDGGIILITHEPLKQAISSKLRYFFHRILAVLDEALYRLCIRSLPDEAKRIDYTMSDFQRQFGGIDPEDVASILKSNGLSIIEVQKYCARRFGLSCVAANTLIRSENTFQVIARR
ncbi:MAG: methyltransferase domain-containing protein [Candidatus Coatesbacteria bacterium]|nr:methyltransferase domain-containing protein [Candidatus Coatesbacteria bacterium]